MRWYYGNKINEFLEDNQDRILGVLISSSGSNAEQTQISAWVEQIKILKEQLNGFKGKVFFEFTIPRMGKRVDAIVLLENIVVVIEFKVGDKSHKLYAKDQVWDYALDLKNFHQTSHNAILLPVLVATEAERHTFSLKQSVHGDGVLQPVSINSEQIRSVLDLALTTQNQYATNLQEWEVGQYLPTPTIVEAALALYGGHKVEDILRYDAETEFFTGTVQSIQSIITYAKQHKKKSICFVTGVPGAGKTLVGLNIATQNIDKESELYSVYLSGNGPLVKVLQEALAIDQVSREKAKGRRLGKGEARSKVKLFIQNIHHFRDDCIALENEPPLEHVVIFDESQRAWNREMTSDFMKRKKNIVDFNKSEPEYLISCMDRHKDWAVIICLVGGGQEINRGEAGIGEWLASIERSFPEWTTFCSPHLVGDNYIPYSKYSRLKEKLEINEKEKLHLFTSMRSFRAPQLSDMVNAILALDVEVARRTYHVIKERYPVMITRDVNKGREWLKRAARGSQRYGMVVSSKAYRLRPHAIDVRIPTDPINWFLGEKEDVRSSYYLEDVATEFQIQGLELDWVCVTWDADLRFNSGRWSHHNFVGSKWQRVQKVENQRYLENAYRVLMTRAREGMILVIPEGSDSDPTRNKDFYDPTYNYLKSIGLKEISDELDFPVEAAANY